VGPPVDTAVAAAFPVIPGYRILDKLAEGGMGRVYRAWQEDLKRPVAIKFIKEEMAASPELLARFCFEAEAIAQLNHPHIVQVYQMLAYAHSRGVIHRDLKPANVMVGSFGEV
jgi:serine/threonine protein kinase